MTKKNAKRDELDRYYTDPRLARACVDMAARCMQWADEDEIADPCAGDGAFTEAIQALRRDRGWSVTPVPACDIDPGVRYPYPEHLDICDVRDWQPHLHVKHGRIDHIIANPFYGDPRTCAGIFRALQRRSKAKTLALLMRGSAIERLVDSDDPPSLIAVSSMRPLWGGPGGSMFRSADSIGVALMMWRFQKAQTTQIRAMPPWRVRGELQWPDNMEVGNGMA